MLDRSPDLVPLLPRLRRLAVALCSDRQAADDLVQAAAARALEKSALYRGGNAAAWAAAILVNLYRSQWRRFASLPAHVDIDDPALHVPAATGEDGAGLDIRRALASLPDEQRIAMLLLALEGLKYSEIAAIQGVPVGTVMSRIARARERLQSALQGYEADVGRRMKVVKP